MLYEYECRDCGCMFFENKSVEERNSPTELPCPHCGASSVFKRISKSNFKIIGASAKNGYSSVVGDVEKHLGREITNEDL